MKTETILNLYWRGRYMQMQAEIADCLVAGNTSVAHERCFHISIHYWAELKSRLKDIVFSRPEEEIDFFKQVKPLYLSSLEYHSLVVHSLTFRPDAYYYQDTLKFWGRQMAKLDKFVSGNRILCAYYESGSKDMDAVYFTARMNMPATDSAIDRQVEAPTPSSVISTYTALRRYREYAEHELTNYRNSHA